MERRPAKKSRNVEIIPAPEDLRQKVGGSRPHNAKAVEAVLDEMNRVMEAQKEHYTRLVHNNVSRFHHLSQDPTLPAERRMREMRGVAHELRGIAGTFGFVLVGRVADSYCTYVAAVDDGGTPNVQVERLHADAMSRALATEGPLDRTSMEVLEGLRYVVARSLPKDHR